MTKEIITILKYAYVKDITLLHNLQVTKTVEGQDVPKYKNRISISYDVKDENGKLVSQEYREHYSDGFDVKMSYIEYKQWQADNEADFIAADKLELVNYQPTEE